MLENLTITYALTLSHCRYDRCHFHMYDSFSLLFLRVRLTTIATTMMTKCFARLCKNRVSMSAFPTWERKVRMQKECYACQLGAPTRRPPDLPDMAAPQYCRAGNPLWLIVIRIDSSVLRFRAWSILCDRHMSGRWTDGHIGSFISRRVREKDEKGRKEEEDRQVKTLHAFSMDSGQTIDSTVSPS